MLVEKGIVDAQNTLCPFCFLIVESNSHLLFTCSFSWGVWMEILNWWKIQGVFHNCCDRFIVEWGGLLKIKKRKKLWNMILGYVLWSIWYERNKIKFEAKAPDYLNFVYNLKIRIGVWAKELLGFEVESPLNFVHNLDAVLA